MKTNHLIGPFSKIYPLTKMPLRGPLKDDQLHCISDGGILVDGKKIVALGKFKELEQRAASVELLQQPLICIPGLIDCHTHLLFGGSRAQEFAMRNSGKSYLEINAAGGGIWSTVQQTRALSDAQMKHILFKRIQQLLLSGITTVEIKSGYGLSMASEIQVLSVLQQVQSQVPIDIVATCLAAHILPKDWNRSSGNYLQTMSENLFPVLRQQALAERIDIFIDHDQFLLKDIHSYLQAAQKQGFDICFHAEQFRVGGVALALDYGAVSVDHLEVIESEQIQGLGASETVAVVLPGACLGLGQAFAPARQLLDAGSCLAIASDYNPGSAPYGNLLLQAALLGTFEQLTTAELIAGLTFRAAAALNLNDRGLLAPFKQADFCAFPAADIHGIFYNPKPFYPAKIWKAGIEITPLNPYTHPL